MEICEKIRVDSVVLVLVDDFDFDCLAKIHGVAFVDIENCRVGNDNLNITKALRAWRTADYEKAHLDALTHVLGFEDNLRIG
jgi:hypothetical protein